VVKLETPRFRTLKTKIICTIGPASSSPEILSGMVKEGMDIARLNFSHGDFSQHLSRLKIIREISSEVGIMQDLPGVKIRIGEFKEGSVVLSPGQEFTLRTSPVEGDKSQAYIDYPELWRFVKPGERVILDDGNLQFRITKVEEGEIRCRVEIGGELKGRKGVVFPDTSLPLPSITDADRKALEFGARIGVDMVAVSFVREAKNVLDVKALLREFGAPRTPVIAKIEEAQGLRNLKSILEVSDAIMVARGDLGVCLPREEVPLFQMRIIKACRRKGKPVIVATQMLESMVSNPVPTRAEVTDVSEAALQGADAVMLSAETAVGKYPIEAVRETRRILEAVENSTEFERVIKSREWPEKPSVEQAICAGMDVISESVGIKILVLETKTGRMAQILSSYRPAKPVYVVTEDERSARSLLLWWGLKPWIGKIEELIRELKREGVLREGDKVLLSREIEEGPIRAGIGILEV
jgi:pyruvate kinase